MKIIIDTDLIHDLSVEGRNIVLGPEAEEALIHLYALKEAADYALKETARWITKKGLQVNPNFVGVKGDIMKVSYRLWGPKYRIDKSMKTTEKYRLNNSRTVANKIRKNSSYRPDKAAVEKYVARHRKLPPGIKSAYRKPRSHINPHDKLGMANYTKRLITKFKQDAKAQIE